MATPSDAPPSSGDGKAPNPVSQVIQPISGDGNDTKVEGVKEISPSSVFVNKEPIREDQVENAIKFLSHPKVRGSPVMYRRSFLERKGLTKEEIDEAFRRVPDPSPAVTTTPPVVTGQDGQIKSSSNGLQQPSAQVLQPASVGPVANNSKMGIIARFQWYHAIFAVGFLAASGAGTVVLFKKTIIPRLKTWIRKVVSEEDEAGSNNEHITKINVALEASAAAKAAAAAASDVARASHDMLMAKSEVLMVAFVSVVFSEKRCFEELINMLSVQTHEMKSMSNAIQKLGSGQSVNGRFTVEDQANQRVSRTSSKQLYGNGNGNGYGNADVESSSVRSLSPPAPTEPSVAPHPKSYMEIMAMIQRGEKPSNIREINDAPPNPNQPVSNPRVAPRPKPWDSNQTQNNSSFNPYYPSQENTPNYENTPWWQQKQSPIITEMETGNESKSGPGSERPVKRAAWVPPQPPPVVMPEAAAAIRQPKKSSVLTDDQLLAAQPTEEITDELQRITKISESGGNNESSFSGIQSSGEITKEENGSYLEA
ncbi:peroxisomal membrane protein PEX14 [Striga asiatica]|uniref:Peroxisomal membrane protein PEX14 n=1 Tax=Striga asiatica TaxID=4170 RepID=A0A5A7RI17_STRAF|nr:peroxisomal membrane protein PEX14 [Striga asiatica]